MRNYHRLVVSLLAMFIWWPVGTIFLSYVESWWYMFLLILVVPAAIGMVYVYERYGTWVNTPASGPFRKEYRNW